MAAVMGHTRNFLGLLRTVQLDELRQEIARPPLVLIVGDDARAAQQFAFALAGDTTPDEAAARRTMTVTTPEYLDTLAAGPSQYDAVLLLDPSRSTLQNRAVRRLVSNQKQTAALAVTTHGMVGSDPGVPTMPINGDAGDPTMLHEVRKRLVSLLPANRRVVWGRNFAGFGKIVSDYLIEQTARQNAQFAIMADLGSKIPLLNIATTGADFVILTRNQMLLAYQLAAINGRDLDSQQSALTNAAPFFVAGLGWRELARRAVRFVPGASLVPKGIVAYGGTVVTGAMARLLSDPEGVRAWLAGVQDGTKTGLGVGSSRTDGIWQRVTQPFGKRKNKDNDADFPLKAQVVRKPEDIAASPVEVIRAK